MAKRLSSQLFVSRLSFYTTNQELKKLFSPFGSVTEARLVMDKRTQRPKGFGFVTFKSDVEAQNALKAMNGRMIRARTDMPRTSVLGVVLYKAIHGTYYHGKEKKEYKPKKNPPHYN